MSDDMVRIVPTGEQTADDIERVMSEVAVDQGIAAAGIGIERVDGQDVVVAPRVLMMDGGRSMVSTFPPKNAAYGTPGPVELVERNPHGPDMVIIEGWKPVIEPGT